MYRLLTYRGATGPRAGISTQDQLFDLADSSGVEAWSSLDAAIAAWRDTEPKIETIVTRGDGVLARPVEGASPLAPLSSPAGIFCAGANYSDHVVEMAEAQGIPPEPDPHSIGLKAWHFIKLARCIAAPGETIPLPRLSRSVDYEAELAVVIGRSAKDVTVGEAMSHVAGYTVANDLSARDLAKRQVPDQSPFRQDWVAHKAWDKSCPLGPWIVPASSIADPQNLAIETWVNGELRQNSSTAKMIFSIAEQISHLSEKLTLQPGDIVLTGTPAGVGTPSGNFLKAGDEVRIRIEKIGEITNRMA